MATGDDDDDGKGATGYDDDNVDNDNNVDDDDVDNDYDDDGAMGSGVAGYNDEDDGDGQQ